jgi:hypothetical protein
MSAPQSAHLSVATVSLRSPRANRPVGEQPWLRPRSRSGWIGKAAKPMKGCPLPEREIATTLRWLASHRLQWQIW